MAPKLRVVVPPHPLIAHWLTMLRNSETPPPLYAKGLEEIGRWLTYEALRNWLPIRQEEVQTPLEKTEGTVVDSSIPLLVLPILPGGLELWHGAREVLPNPHLCLGGVPNTIEKNSGVLIYLDQIVNGKEVLINFEELKERGIEAKQLMVITALASKQGLKEIGEQINDLTIYSACIDAEISGKYEIKPGIGNPLSRLNTRVKTSN